MPNVADGSSFLRLVAEAYERLGDGGGSRLDGHWIRVVNDAADVRQQGWKLHVTAGHDSAEQVLERVRGKKNAAPHRL